MLKYNPNGRNRCFYCNETSDKSLAIDHVIPFDYVLDTDLFNSVPACKSCNSVKSNRLPDYKTNFKLVLARNEKMNLKFYDSNNFDKLYDDCLREYHGDRGFFINKYKK